MGGPAPTRPVASAGKGQDDHMSEVVSHLLEPVANNSSGGMEANSTPDVLSSIDQLNERVGDLEEIDLEAVDKELDDLVNMDVDENLDEVESTPTDDDKDHSREETGSRSSILRGTQTAGEALSTTSGPDKMRKTTKQDLTSTPVATTRAEKMKRMRDKMQEKVKLGRRTCSSQLRLK